MLVELLGREKEANIKPISDIGICMKVASFWDQENSIVIDYIPKNGWIAHIDLKIPPKPPGYAFVEFEEFRDAESAIRGRDGYDFAEHRLLFMCSLKVELAHGGRGQSSKSDRYSSLAGRGRGGASRHSDYRVSITGLPSSTSWQDLKDHMRNAGDVCFSQVFRDGDESEDSSGLALPSFREYTFEQLKKATSGFAGENVEYE